ncbi:unnamed protein product, partial [Symbiodinium pilosum]
MAQLDKGLDARQQMIDALKAQLSKSAALPKAKPAAVFRQPAASPVAASGYGAVGAVAIAPSSYFLQPRPQILQPPVRVPVVQPQMQLQHLQSVPQLQTFPTGAPSPQMMMAAP